MSLVSISLYDLRNILCKFPLDLCPYFAFVVSLQVLLEIVGVKDLPENLKGSYYVSFTKSQPDTFFNVKRRLNILSQSQEKMVASFICEPKGKLLFELVSYSSSSLLIKKTSKVVGSTSLSLEDYLVPVSKLSDQKWFELKPCSGCETSKPISLHIAVSFSVPTTAPYMLHMVPSRPFGKSSCLFPLPARVQHAKSWTRVFTDDGNEIISFQMRYINFHFQAVPEMYLPKEKIIKFVLYRLKSSIVHHAMFM